MFAARCVATAVAIAALVSSALQISNATAAARGCPKGTELSIDEASGLDVDVCDVQGLIVSDGKTKLAIPDRGTFVTLAVLDEEGVSAHLSVATTDEGIVEVKGEGDTGQDQALGSVMAAPAPDRCTDNRNQILDHKWFEAAKYYVNIYENLPANISPITFRDSVVASAKVLQDGINRCGIRVDPDLTLTMVGGTTRNSNVNGATASCTKSGDGLSVVDSGYLVGNNLGVACARGLWRPGLNIAKEVDIRVDSTTAWTLSSHRCVNKHDLRGVLTHEFGHFVGLDHAAGSSSRLTMSSSMGACTFDRRHLGKGDVTGLLRFY